MVALSFEGLQLPSRLQGRSTLLLVLIRAILGWVGFVLGVGGVCLGRWFVPGGGCGKVSLILVQIGILKVGLLTCLSLLPLPSLAGCFGIVIIAGAPTFPPPPTLPRTTVGTRNRAFCCPGGPVGMVLVVIGRVVCGIGRGGSHLRVIPPHCMQGSLLVLIDCKKVRKSLANWLVSEAFVRVSCRLEETYPLVSHASTIIIHHL